MKRAISDQLLFLSQTRKAYTTTGAVAPSSRFLAAAITSPLQARTQPARRGRMISARPRFFHPTQPGDPRGKIDRPRRILEVGPGTGAFTRRIVSLLEPEDRLDLVELNPVFAELLKQRFQRDKAYQRAAAQAEIHVCPLQEFQSDGLYDYIISGLPLNNFSAELVGEIFASFFRLLAPGGVLSYFEYMYIRKLRGLVSGNSEKQRLRALEEIMNSYLQDHRFRRDRVFVNFPPAWVQHLRNESLKPGSSDNRVSSA